MLKRIALGLLGLLVLLVVGAGLGLAWAHYAVRHERTPLPALAAVRTALLRVPDGPVRLALVNTASQPMPRSAVLEAIHDPRPDSLYTMSHPAFVLEWADGRLLLIDTGMTREGAVQFGALVERLSGGEPIRPHQSVADRLGKDVGRVQGIIFTHLHADHVGGTTETCDRAQHPIDVFMTEAQTERPNYTTRSALGLVRAAGCVKIERLPGARLATVPGFPGVTVVRAGGHTPGSLIVLAHVGGAEGRDYAFVGDVANHLEGILYNIPKPFAYRVFVTPEDEVRLAELRRFARILREEAGATLLLSHDQRSLEETGIAQWPG